MSGKFSLKELDNNFDFWEKLIINSPQCNIYLSSNFLNNLNRKIKYFLIYKSNEPVAGISLLIDNNEQFTELDDLVVYNGIFFIDRTKKRSTGTRAEQFEITEFAIKELNKLYNTIVMTLHPKINDIRPFLWYNYNSKNNKFFINIKYTSYLEFDKKNDNIDFLLPRMSSIRRQQIRYGAESRSRVIESNDIEKFIIYYSKLLDGTGNALDDNSKLRLKNLIKNLLLSKQAIMFECQDIKKNTTYMTIFSNFNYKSIYLFGAPNYPNQRAFDGTFTLWESFRILFNKYKILEIDLEGVNSPNRGKYKLSFGGKLQSYFQVTLNY